MKKEVYINIKDIAKAKGLKSTRSLRMELNKPESKYISREIKVNGGTSYEILFSSLEPELQNKLRESETKSTALVPLNYQPSVVTDKARQTANHRINIVKAALEHRKKYPTQNQADHEFLELYNTGLFLTKAYEFMGSISIGTLRRYIQAYKKTGNAESLIPQYQITKQGEYNSILDENMKKVLLTLLLHQNKFGFNTAIRLTKQILIKQGYDEESLPSSISFKRYAEHFRDNNYAEWTLKREGIKAYHDKVEPYIERDISKIEVGDVIIADGHVLNFQVINPFTGKPTRARVFTIGDDSNKLYTYNGDKVEELQISRETFEKLFPPDIPYSKFEQGQTGDCYLISSLGTLMSNDVARTNIYKLFSEDDKGNVSITFPDKKPIIFPNGELILDEDEINRVRTEIPAIQMLEEAYGKNVMDGMDQEELKKAIMHAKSDNEYNFKTEIFATFGQGGAQEDVFKTILGENNCEVECVYDGTESEKLLENLNKFASNPNYMFLFSTPDVCSDREYINKEYNLTGNHAYRIENYDKENGLISVVNPWDNSDIRTIPVYDFLNYIDDATIVNLGGKKDT